MIEKVTDSKAAEVLFGDWQETLIWSCLQGTMGALYGDQGENPTAVMAMLGDFAFLAGEPNESFVRYRPENCENDFMILVPQNEAWGELIEKCYGDKAKKVSRYAIKKEPGIFDREKLQNLAAALPGEYERKMIDKTLFLKCMEGSWNRDLVSQYKDYETYKEWGLGVVILKDGEIVSGASSYSGYRGGIEIEIDTREDYRRKGLATVCGASLILECLERNLYPSWDAQNLWSVGLAEKLGYHYSHTYTAYEIRGYANCAQKG